MAETNKRKSKSNASKKSGPKQSRKRNYRIPHKKDTGSGQVHFPTVEVLFDFVRGVLKDLVQEERDENIFDSEVARFIYPGYPYAHQFKLGLKNVSNVIELTLLTRNLGVPFEWIQKIRRGDWTQRQAEKAYKQRKDGAALAAQATHTGSAGQFDVTVRVEDHDPAILGDVYAAVIHDLREVVSDVKVDKKAGTFI